jgi:hypothetical protein
MNNTTSIFKFVIMGNASKEVNSLSNYYKWIITIIAIIVLPKESEAQGGTNGNAFPGSTFIGYNASNTTSPLLFKTNALTRMRLNGANVATGTNPISQGYLGISPRPINPGVTWFDTGNPDPNNTPLSMVHLYGPNNTTFGVGGGWRSWMQTGLFINEHSDNMYVGMKPNLAPGIVNQSDAVIAWGDDPIGSNGPNGPLPGDMLRFIFTAYPAASGLMGSPQGMEMARMGALGNTGFGNYQIPVSRQAVRRVEILDADPNSPIGANQNAPQLRTTYIYNTNPALGVFTEFQTTSLGDMYFNTRSNSTRRRFGFHTSTPGNTVEINSLINGSSGLRFTNMLSTNTPQVNPGSGVLSVNATGDVIYVTGGSSPTADNGLSIAAGNIVQLGVPCNVNGSPNFAGIAASLLTTDRVIPNGNQNLWIASLNAQTGGVGIGGQPVNTFCNTGNTLELSANLKGKYGNTDASGLRFTKLTSTSPVVSGNGVTNKKVLTVDKDGDVVLIDACCMPSGNILAQNGTNVVNGNTVELGTNPLIHNTDIPMNQSNLSFTDANSIMGQGKVTIGGLLNVSAKLLINNRTEQQGLILQNTTPGGCYGISNTVSSTSSTSPNLGIYSNTTGSTVRNTGVFGLGFGASNINYGGYFQAQNGTQNIGIYAHAIQSPLNYAGLFDGNVNVNGSLTVIGVPVLTSDLKFKKNITNVSNALSIIQKLKPKTYYFDTEQYGSRINFSKQEQHGFIAQDVATVLPELVTDHVFPATYDSLGKETAPAINYKGLNYIALIPILMKGIQEQQAIIDSKDSIISNINDRLTRLEKCLSSILPELCQINQASTQSNSKQVQEKLKAIIDVNLLDKNVIILSQNAPNPFAESTIINYSLPITVQKAQINFYNMSGILIQVVNISEKRTGMLNVFGDDLSSGIYTYTLIADGKVIETKKMVKQ